MNEPVPTDFKPKWPRGLSPECEAAMDAFAGNCNVEPETEPIAASINAACKLWWVNSGEYEADPDSQYWGAFWEPLGVKLPATSKPSCCLGNKIVFYDHTGNRQLADYVSHYDFCGIHPHLLFLDGMWREVVGGRCEFRKGQWQMRWSVATNGRWSKMMNAGFYEFKH